MGSDGVCGRAFLTRLPICWGCLLSSNIIADWWLRLSDEGSYFTGLNCGVSSIFLGLFGALRTCMTGRFADRLVRIILYIISTLTLYNRLKEVFKILVRRYI